MPVNLANVNISLQQFQDISSGKYNAGEVRLESETELGKINHHVHLTGSNAKSLSHAEVLAVKNAFVKALSDSGVGADEIARIRHDLGLAAESGADKSLHERSLRPLTRQQVRQILDRNAAAINAGAAPGAAPIRTSAQIYGANGMRESRAGKRDAVNASLGGAGRTAEHEGVAYAEAVVAGDVDFRPPEDTKPLLAQARAQLAQILETSKGEPSAEREAVVQFRINATGQRVRIPTGMSEKAYVRKLEETVIRLSRRCGATEEERSIRAVCAALPGKEARLAWLDKASTEPEPGHRARTAAVWMLQQAGIADGDTLARVNRITEAQAVAFALSLAELDGAVRGDELRAHPVMQMLEAQSAGEGAKVPDHLRTHIPATTSQEWNLAVWTALDGGDLDRLPHEFRPLLDGIVGHVRAMFGPDEVPSWATHSTFTKTGGAKALVPKNDPAAPPVSAAGIRDALLAAVERRAAERCAVSQIEQAIAGLNVPQGTGLALFNAIAKSRPQLRERLLASRSAAETAAILAEHRAEIESDARRNAAIERCKNKAVAVYKDVLARGLGLPSAAFAGDAIDTRHVLRKADDLAGELLSGKRPAADDAAIEAAVREMAERFARGRAESIRSVDALQIPQAFKDALKEHLFNIDRVDKLDVPATIEATHRELAAEIDALDAALVPNAPKDQVYQVMRTLSQKVDPVLRGLFPPGTEIGGDEHLTHDTVIYMAALHAKEGLFAKMAAFLARPDVAADNSMNQKDLSFCKFSYQTVVNQNGTPAAVVADALGTLRLPVMHLRALLDAFEDAGLGQMPLPAKLGILRPAHPAGAALAAALRALPGAVSLSALREMAAPILRQHGGGGFAGRAPEASARQSALLEKYGGGLPEADRARLADFADGLDFSEGAMRETERALAEFLDEMTGGGGFASPNSSASRRALAAGFRPEELTELHRISVMLQEVDANSLKDAVDILLDPQSDFRRGYDAAIARLAPPHPGQEPRPLRLEEKLLVAHAVIESRNDADLLAVVTNGIGRVTTGGDGSLRTPTAVAENVLRVKADIEEVRRIAGDDPAVLAAGMNLLKGLETRRIPAGFLRHLVDSARALPLEALASLRARSKATDIHLALAPLNRAITRILRDGPGRKLLDGADEIKACQWFLLELVVGRLSPAQRRSVRAALESANASALNALYQDVSDQNAIEFPAGTSNGVTETASRHAIGAQQTMQNLFQLLGRSLDVPDPDAQIPFPQGNPDYGRMRAADIVGDLLRSARETVRELRDEVLLHAAGAGRSPASRALRDVYGRFIGPEPFNPDMLVSSTIARSVSHALGYGAVRGAKSLVASDDLAGTPFAQARQAGLRVELPGGRLLSNDPATARDELARFVTGRPDAAWGTLAAGERNQVAVLMSLLTHESALAAVQAPPLALDPEGREAAFSYVGAGDARPVFRLEVNRVGEINVDCELELHPAALLVGGETHELAPGATVKGAFRCSIYPEERQRIAEMDLAHADTAEAEAFYNRNPPEPRRLRGAYERIPDASRPNLAVAASFDILNA